MRNSNNHPEELRLSVNFHGIGAPERSLESGEANVWISVAAMNQILDMIEGRTDVQITCDDGNASDYTTLLPALASRGLTCTFFIITSRLGQPGALSRSHLVQLQSAGMKIGLHGHAHRSWRRLSPEAAREELVEARSRLEEAVGSQIVEAACPFGDYDGSAIRRLQSLGYSKVYTSDGGWHKASQFVIPRNSVGVGRLNLKVHELEQVLSRPRIGLQEKFRRYLKRIR